MRSISSFLWACGLGSIFFLLFGAMDIPVFAQVNIPFNREDSGLDVIPQGEDIVREDAPDAGADQLVNIALTVFFTLRWVLGFAVLIWVVYAGMQMVAASSNQDTYQRSVRMVLYSITSLVIVLLIPPFVLDIFYGGGSAGVSVENQGINDLTAAADNFRLQVDGLLTFFKTLLVFIAMAYVILSGIRMITAFGSDEALGTAKKMFFPIGFGILIIVFNEVFIDFILYDIAFEGERVEFQADSSSASVFIEQLVGFVQYVLQFLGLLVFGFLVYGGFLYIVSFGNEETANRGRNIFINAIIAMVIIVFSYILMWSLVNFSLTAA